MNHNMCVVLVMLGPWEVGKPLQVAVNQIRLEMWSRGCLLFASRVHYTVLLVEGHYLGGDRMESGCIT